MADVTISSLTNRQPNSSAVFPYSEGGTTYNASLNQIIPTQIIPTGVIVMWSGSIASIPSGWALCNGSNGTPDLRNQFIIGASVDVSGQSQTGVTGDNTKTGGSADAIVVSHTHPFSISGSTSTGGDHSHSGGCSSGATGSGPGVRPYSVTNTGTAGAHSHSFSGSGTTSATGSTGTNANLPPYYALAYIMKL